MMIRAAGVVNHHSNPLRAATMYHQKMLIMSKRGCIKASNSTTIACLYHHVEDKKHNR